MLAGPTDHLRQGVVVAGHVQDPTGTAVDAELVPGQRLKELFEGPDAGYGVTGAICLVIWGTLGMLVTAVRVRREMIP